MTLTRSEFRLLRVLYAEDDELTVFDLRRMLRYSDHTLFTSIRRAIEKGYVQRVGRGRYKITKKGKNLLELLEA